MKRITVCCFLFLLGSFTIFSLVFPETLFSEKENRFLQTRPNFSTHKLINGTFGQEYESYLSDQFPFRDTWISFHAQMERTIGKTKINNVYVGKDNYFMESFDSSTFSSAQTQKNIDSLACLNTYLQTVEVNSRIMIIPTASEILTEKLPPFAHPYSQDSFLNQIEQQVGYPSSLCMAVSHTLSDHANEEIYYRTDHHWTSLGAFYAYETWANSLGIIPYKKEDFDIQTVSCNFYGTIDAKLPLATIPDSIHTYTNRFVSFTAIYNKNPDTTRTSLFDLTALSKRDQYSLYLGGNYGLIEITPTNPVSSSTRRLLIIKDSYANCFAPIAAGHFAYTAVIDPRFYSDNIKDFITKNKITDLLVLYSASGFAQDRYFSMLVSSIY